MSANNNQPFQEKLKALYLSQDKIPPLIEGLDEIPEYSLKDYYVHLQTVVKEDNKQATKAGDYEKVKGEKAPISMEMMFNQLKGQESSKSSLNKILVLGGAGAGKSTLLQCMAYRWSLGELWADKFEHVYRIGLKSILNPEWSRRYTPDQIEDDLLKCLVHHTLSNSLEPARRKEFKLEKMDWPESKEKVLLLLDGYDEISHLKDDKNSDWNQLFSEILSHKYVIFSSRPNAVDAEVKKKFDRVIENAGLDYNGIKQYFTRYFKDKPEESKALESFLDANSSIREICKIPVNIAMLCYSWSQSKGEAEAKEISNVADLYSKVLKHLGERYFAAKKWKGSAAENQTLKERLTNGELILDEIKVLRHLAFKAFSGGGIKVDEKKRYETLIVKGAWRTVKNVVDINDEDGISIQSSINYLYRVKEINQASKVTVRDVYKYGILRVEGSGSAPDKETDLQAQDYTFIHLTFEEYLTACYLKELLKIGDEHLKRDVCQYLAERRNQPRNLMALKFMAGIISVEVGEEGDQAVKMFWDAMTCNVDGLIELGVETKVSLIMHLLGQATVDGELDKRIPNLETMTDLVDAVVINDVLNWESQLKESDYISGNIKAYLLRVLEDCNFAFVPQMLKDIQDQATSSALQNVIATIQKRKEPMEEKTEEMNVILVMDVISSLLAKFKDEELNKIVNFVSKILEAKKQNLLIPVVKILKGIVMQGHFPKSETGVNISNQLIDLLPVLTSDLVVDIISLLIEKETDAGALGNLVDRLFTRTQLSIYSRFANASPMCHRLMELYKTTRSVELAVKLVENFYICDVKNPIAGVTDFDGKLVSEMVDNQGIACEIIEQISKNFIRSETGKEKIFENFIKTIKLIVSNNKNSEKQAELLKKLTSLLGDESNNSWIRTVSAFAIALIAEATKDKETATKVYEKIKNLVNDKEIWSKVTLIYAVSRICELIEDTGIIIKMIIQDDILSNNDVSGDTKALIIKVLNMLVKKSKEKQTILQLIGQILKHCDSSGGFVTFFDLFPHLNKDTKEKNVIIADTLVGFSEHFKDRGINLEIISQVAQLMSGTNNEKILSFAVSLAVNISKSAKDDDKVSSFNLEKAIELISHNDVIMKGYGVELAIELANLAENELIRAHVCEQVFPHLPTLQQQKYQYRLISLVETIKDSKLMTIISDTFMEHIAKGDARLKKFASETVIQIYQKNKNNYLIEELFKKATQSLADSDTNVNISGIEIIDYFVRKVKGEKADLVSAAMNSNAVNLLAHEDLRLRDRFFLLSVSVIEAFKDKQLIEKVLDNIDTLIAVKGPDLERRIGVIISQAFSYVKEDKMMAEKLSSVIIRHFFISDFSLIVSQSEVGLPQIVEVINDNTFIDQVGEKLINLLYHENPRLNQFGVKYLKDISSNLRIIELMKQKVPTLRSQLQVENWEDKKVAFKIAVGMNSILQDNALATEINEQWVKLMTDDNLAIKQAMLETCQQNFLMISDKEKRMQIFEQILTLFSDKDTKIRIDAVVLVKNLIKHSDATTILGKTIADVSKLTNDNDLEVRRTALDVLASFVELTIEEEEKIKIAEQIINHFGDLDLENNLETLEKLVEILRQPKSKNNAERIAKSIFGLFSANVPPNVKQLAFLLLENLSSEELSVKACSYIDGPLSDPDWRLNKVALTFLASKIKLIKDKDFLIKMFKKVAALRNYQHEQAYRAGFVIEFWTKRDVIKVLTEIALNLKDKELKAQTVDLMVDCVKNPINQKNLNEKDYVMLEQLAVSDAVLICTPALVKGIDDKESNIQLIEKIHSAGSKSLVGREVIESVLSPKEAFSKYNKSPALGPIVIRYLANSLQKFSETLNKIDEIFRSKDKLNADYVINNLLQGNQKSLLAGEDIKKAFAIYKENDASSVRNLRQVLQLRLGCFEDSQPSEIIEMCLLAMGYAENNKDEVLAKNLSKVCQEIIDRQVELLNQETLEWLDKNFERVATLTRKSKEFFKKVYYKLLEDSKITALEKNLIIKFINHGLTTTISRTLEVIFEGNRYTIQGDNTDIFLEEIADAVVAQEQDILASQYKDHKPIFPKSHTTGMQKAAAVIEVIYSTVDKSYALESGKCLLTQLKSEGGQELLLLEKRSAIGDHLIYQLSAASAAGNKYKLTRLNPAANDDIQQQAKLEEIFGKYSKGLKYKGKSKRLDAQEGSKILNGEIKDVITLLTSSAEKEYFHQELLGLSNTDRVDYIFSELGTKMTNYDKVLSERLQGNSAIASASRDSIREYYDAFTGTFALVYTTSQVIQSGQLQLSLGDTKTKVISTIISYAPFVGDSLSSTVTSISEFLQSREMIKNARQMLTMANDGVGLNQLVGELACSIILNHSNKVQQITTITDEQLKTSSKKLIDRLMQVFSDIGESVDNYLYGSQYKTAAGKLGRDDANKLIAAWVKGGIPYAKLKQEFTNLALVDVPGGSQTPPARANTGNNQKTGRSSCCEMF